MNDEPAKGEKRQSAKPQNGGQAGLSLWRDLKCTLPAEEFGAVQWAAKRAGHLAPPGGRAGRALPLADFLRLAVLEQVRAIVRVEIERGKNIPPDVAHCLPQSGGGKSAGGNRA